jgi:hypothetical protein
LRIPTTALLALVAGVAGAQPSPPARELVELLRIDGSSQDWARVTSVRVAPGGQILVTEFPGSFIRVFSPGGELVRRLGREGQGPGEFVRLGGMGVIGDTIWAGDLSQRRLTMFDVTGKLLATILVDSAPGMAGIDMRKPGVVYSWSSPMALFPDGTLLVAPSAASHAIAAAGLDHRYPLWRTTRRGRVLDTVATVARGGATLEVVSGTRRTYTTNPFPARGHFAVSPDGRRLVIVEATYAGSDAGSYEVRLRDERRRQIYSTRFSGGAAPIPSRMIDSIVDVLTAGMGRGIQSPNAAQLIRESLAIPPVYPAVWGVMVGSDGGVWLKGGPDPAGVKWTVLDPRGIAVATIREPRNTRFIALDRGLWAIERDSSDVESIVRYRMR